MYLTEESAELATLNSDEKWARDFGAPRKRGMTLIDTDQWRHEHSTNLSRDTTKQHIKVKITSQIWQGLVELETFQGWVLEFYYQY